MTPKDLFLEAYKRTLAANGAKFDGSHADECWRAVQGYPESLYDGAATRLNETCRFLPKPAEWVEAVRDLQAAEEREQRAARDAAWAREAEKPETFSCPVCRDTGWEPITCTDKNWCSSCRRHKSHPYDHDAVTECTCRPTNPIYQQKRERQVAAISRQDATRAARKYQAMGDAA